MNNDLEIFDTDEFISILPHIIEGKNRLKAVFASYNTIGCYETGFVDTGKKDLEIFVINGCRNDVDSLFGYLYALTSKISNNTEHILESIRTYEQLDSRKSLDCIRGTSLSTFDTDAEFLYFTYIGLNAMDESIAFARDIKRTYPKATVLAVACDCNISRKISFFKEANKKGEIDFTIICQTCGGIMDMNKLLKGLIQAW